MIAFNTPNFKLFSERPANTFGRNGQFRQTAEQSAKHADNIYEDFLDFEKETDEINKKLPYNLSPHEYIY